MSELNVPIPSFDCLIRAPYLYDDMPHHEGFVRARAFGLASIQGRALGFHVMDAIGAVIWRLPISALVLDARAPELPLDHLQLWDCFSPHVTVTEFPHLLGRRCQVTLKDKKKYEGRSLFTVDWHGNDYANGAGEGGHKCAQIIALDNGCLAAQPNNRILWADPATIERPFARRPDYLTNTRAFSVEGTTKWVTGPGMFYDAKQVKGRA